MKSGKKNVIYDLLKTMFGTTHSESEYMINSWFNSTGDDRGRTARYCIKGNKSRPKHK